MNYFIKLVQDDGAVGWVNPDHVHSIFPEVDGEGKKYYAIRIIGQNWDKPVTFYGKDIDPLINAIRQELVTYTIPIESVIGPQPRPPF